MGAYLLVDTRQHGRLLDDVKDHDAREGLAAVIQEERSLGARGGGALLHVELNLVARNATNGYKALLIALTHDAYVALTEEEVADF